MKILAQKSLDESQMVKVFTLIAMLYLPTSLMAVRLPADNLERAAEVSTTLTPHLIEYIQLWSRISGR